MSPSTRTVLPTICKSDNLKAVLRPPFSTSTTSSDVLHLASMQATEKMQYAVTAVSGANWRAGRSERATKRPMKRGQRDVWSESGQGR